MALTVNCFAYRAFVYPRSDLLRFYFVIFQRLHRNGIKISNGTIVHATIISAPSGTRNAANSRTLRGGAQECA